MKYLKNFYTYLRLLYLMYYKFPDEHITRIEMVRWLIEVHLSYAMLDEIKTSQGICWAILFLTPYQSKRQHEVRRYVHDWFQNNMQPTKWFMHEYHDPKRIPSSAYWWAFKDAPYGHNGHIIRLMFMDELINKILKLL